MDAVDAPPPNAAPTVAELREIAGRAHEEEDRAAHAAAMALFFLLETPAGPARVVAWTSLKLEQRAAEYRVAFDRTRSAFAAWMAAAAVARGEPPPPAADEALEHVRAAADAVFELAPCAAAGDGR
jgi:hypothetical protein